MSTFEPAPRYEISELETIKIVSDPLRLNLLHLVTPRARTVKQVADILHLEPHKLYYHMNLLEEHGLVKLVDQVVVGGVVEKYYRAVATHFQFASNLLNPQPGESGTGFHQFADFVFQGTRDALYEGIDEGWIVPNEESQYPLVLSRRMAMLTEDEAVAFTKQLSRLLGEFVAASQEDDSETREPYLLLGAFFRTAAITDLDEEHPAND